jgi:Fe-Mn family superoxide dismutase
MDSQLIMKSFSESSGPSPSQQPALSAVSRRRFLGIGGLAVAAGILPPLPRAWAAAVAADPLEGAMPVADGVFEVAPLPYADDALEPVIDAETMRLHHGKHYAGYTAKLNAALEEAPELKGKSLAELLGDVNGLPESVRKAIRNNGGGYYNHSLFWRMMSPDGGGDPSGAVAAAIDAAFGDFATMREKFNAEAGSVFGSGWTWLIVNADGELEITTTPNQDSPIMTGIGETTGQPILGLDVWEHAYYLKYKNERAKYLAAWWELVNWQTVNELSAAAKA